MTNPIISTIFSSRVKNPGSSSMQEISSKHSEEVDVLRLQSNDLYCSRQLVSKVTLSKNKQLSPSTITQKQLQRRQLPFIL